MSLPKTNLADGAAVEPLLMVEPGAYDEIDIRSVGLPRLECFVQRDVAVDIFLIPQAVHQHGGAPLRLAWREFDPVPGPARTHRKLDDS